MILKFLLACLPFLVTDIILNVVTIDIYSTLILLFAIGAIIILIDMDTDENNLNSHIIMISYIISTVIRIMCYNFKYGFIQSELIFGLIAIKSVYKLKDKVILFERYKAAKIEKERKHYTPSCSINMSHLFNSVESLNGMTDLYNCINTENSAYCSSLSNTKNINEIKYSNIYNKNLSISIFNKYDTNTYHDDDFYEFKTFYKIKGDK